MVAVGQGDDVDVDGLLLDVDHPRLAEVVAGENPLELAEVDAEIGADDPHLVVVEIRAAGEVHRLAAAVEEQGAQGVVVVREQVGEDVLELHAGTAAPQRWPPAARASTAVLSRREGRAAPARISPASKARRKAVTILASKRLPVRRVIVSTANCRL